MSGIPVKPLLAAALSLPLGWLGWLLWLEIGTPGAGLGPDAGEALVHYLGEWSLIMLLLAYSVSPMRRLAKSRVLARSRRMVGLFAFGYVALHITSYLLFYLGFAWAELLEDLVERPYITAGMAAFVCLLCMALTSTRGWQRRLKKNWQRLHRLIFPALVLALVHLWWLTRDGFAEVSLFTLWFLVMSIERLAASGVFTRPRGVAHPPQH